MRDICYIKINKNGIPADRIYKSRPSLKAGEIDVKIIINLPDIIFECPLQATLKVDEDKVKGRVIRELEFELKGIIERE